MIINNTTKDTHAIFKDAAKTKNILIKPGENTISKEDYALLKNDAWFNYLINTGLFTIPGTTVKKQDKKQSKSKTKPTKVSITKG